MTSSMSPRDRRRGKESLIKDTKEYVKWHSCPPFHLFPVRCGTFCSRGRLVYHSLAWGFCQESPRWQDCRWNEWAITELLGGKLLPLCLWGRGSLVRAKSWIQEERCQLDSDCISLWSSRPWVLTAWALFFFSLWHEIETNNNNKKPLCFAVLSFTLMQKYFIGYFVVTEKYKNIECFVNIESFRLFIQCIRVSVLPSRTHHIKDSYYKKKSEIAPWVWSLKPLLKKKKKKRKRMHSRHL